MHQRLLHGPAVRRIRELTGIPHGKFAIELDVQRPGKKEKGITPGYLTKIEQGKQQPSPEIVAAIAKQLGVSIDDITYVVSAEAMSA